MVPRAPSERTRSRDRHRHSRPDPVAAPGRCGRGRGVLAMSAIVDIRGQTFGRLRVLSRVASSHVGRARWCCQCACGKRCTVEGKKLRSGHTRSCGCYAQDFHKSAEFAAKFIVHGEARTGRPSVEYKTWTSCSIAVRIRRSPAYSDYGGRGIRVCRRWKKFSNFLADVGRRPTSRHSIERRNNSKGYNLTNCCWATRREQQRNTRRNHLRTLAGETHPLIVWAERYGLKKQTLRMRLTKGWSVQRAITEPLHT
jgi:hypothetical protein